MAAGRKPSTDVIVRCESLSLEVEEDDNKGQEQADPSLFWRWCMFDFAFSTIFSKCLTKIPVAK